MLNFSKKNRALLVLHILSSVSAIIADIGDEASYETCDHNSVPSNVSPSTLMSNSFHKICPGTFDSSKPLSQPICGDGTAFSFLYHKPHEHHTNQEKILIEFQGGGACWDTTFCQLQKDLLTFPTEYDEMIGNSCSLVDYIASTLKGYSINFLCASTIGNIDLSEYNYITVPYCSQDTHLGDNSMSYNHASVYHHGAHNMVGVLNWIYEHFPNPSQIFLTGCSAGGSPLPIVYDLINDHYNDSHSKKSKNKNKKEVNINTIIDSAAILTPEPFLRYGIQNWNPWTILDKTSFQYDLYDYDVDIPTRFWQHALRQGSTADNWAFVTHEDDSISMGYWQLMGGGMNGDTWNGELSKTLSTIQAEFSNVNVFQIEGEGHCTFGLEDALQVDGFEAFAEDILMEPQLKEGKKKKKKKKKKKVKKSA